MAAAGRRTLPPSQLLLLLLGVGGAVATSSASTTPPTSLYIAANFRDNAATVPSFAAQLLRLAADVGPANLFVTV